MARNKEEKPSRKKAAPDEPVKRGKKAPVDEKPSRRRKKEPEDETPIKLFNPLDDLDARIDDIEKTYALTGDMMLPGEKRQTTGLLGLDLVLGGGIVPGWYTTLGPEQSCKSTLTLQILIACIFAQINVKAGFDYEGSMMPDYFEKMLRTNNMDFTADQVFGVRDPKTQEWVVKPIVRKYDEVIAEKFFDFLAKLERTLPDKRLMGENWYYIYEDTKANKTKLSGHYDERYYKKTGKLRVLAPDGRLQALILVDSYPAMLPEKQDVDDPNSAIAMQARMFSEQLKRVKGRMKAKRIAVLGVNQLRKVPMAMYGPSESEPCGTALQFFSDARLKATPRALSGVPITPFNKGKGMIMEEDAIRRGKDQYRFIHIKAIKNKLSMPYLETWVRLWIEDSTGEARGFDPVWDTFYYLVQTGQADWDGKRMALSLNKGPEFKRAVSWRGFKLLVLGSSKEREDLCDGLGIKKTFDIRGFCKTQLADKNGMELYLKHKQDVADSKAIKASKKAAKVANTSSDDEDDI